MKCIAIDCDRMAIAKDCCLMHYKRLQKYGDPNYRIRRERGSGSLKKTGHMMYENGKAKLLHRIIAESALGKPLPAKAVIHHIDHNRFNNSHSNLVICPNNEYHQLLHRRERLINYLNKPNSTTGVTFQQGLWSAKIGLNCRFLYIGQFHTIQEAIDARRIVIKSLLAGHPFRGEYL